MIEPIANNVFEQMKNDILNGDWTAIYELLVLLEKDKSARTLLIDYLVDEEKVQNDE
tara:strand:- start:4115 stop:4285 length:171 start_codon:yes stop_codon:yes gene_type:complete